MTRKKATAEDKAEVALLRERCDLIGIKYAPATGAKKLTALLAAATSDTPPESIEEQAPVVTEVPPSTLIASDPKYLPPEVTETAGARAARLRHEANLLVRVIVANMNPEKREWSGEVYSVGNSVVGQVKKFVPFNNDAGWHIPQIILNHLQEKQCQIWVNQKNARGETVRVGRLINELNVQILPPLSYDELKSLGQRQAMASGQAA